MAQIEIPFADRDEVALVGSWLYDGDDLVGLHLHHPYDQIGTDGRWPRCGGGGYIAWVQRKELVARHQLVAGGPDDVEHLTISPSLWHRARDQNDITNPQHGDGSRCSPHRECHGFIRNGRWEPC